VFEFAQEHQKLAKKSIDQIEIKAHRHVNPLFKKEYEVESSR
jgi:hypothetical protein